MLIVRLLGGLGNQMFQYAAGRAIAYRCGLELKFDITEFKNFADRAYRLGVFNVVGQFATPREIYRLRPRRRHLLRYALHDVISKFRPYTQQPIFREQQRFVYDPHVFALKGDVYLLGSWQNERYFADIAEMIRQDFTWKFPPDEVNQRTLLDIQQNNAVSVHVRRGDYVTNPNASQFHGILGLDYYREAIALIEQQVQRPHFFVFSDDAAWVKQNLHFQAPVTFVEQNGLDQDYEDLRLMRACKHHIIANSTFSWWGAWLGDDPAKIVIAPKQWLVTEENVHANSLILDGWIKL